MAGGPGFEPRLTESESAVLPLNYPPAGIRKLNETIQFVRDGLHLANSNSERNTFFEKKIEAF